MEHLLKEGVYEEQASVLSRSLPLFYFFLVRDEGFKFYGNF